MCFQSYGTLNIMAHTVACLIKAWSRSMICMEEKIFQIFYQNLDLSYLLRSLFIFYFILNKANFLLREVWKTFLPTFLGNDSDIKFEIS